MSIFFKKNWGVCFAVLSIIILVALQIHNLVLFPITWGFDAGDHIKYIQYLQTYHRIPLANEGMELYQAPLYYILASFISNLQSVKIIGLAGYLSLIIFGYLLFRNRSLSLIAAVLIGSLPLTISHTFHISNEFFSGVVMSAVVTRYILKRKDNNFFFFAVLGILLGLSILAKVTAGLLVLAIFIDMLLDKKINKKFIVMVFGIICIVGGWYYLRNIIVFHRPFVESIDFPQYQFWKERMIKYRDLRFFTDLSGFLSLDVFRARGYSLWTGTYFTWFYDGYYATIPPRYSSLGIPIVLFSFPVFLAFVYGYIKELKQFFRSEFRVLLLHPLFLFAGYIYNSVKLPFGTEVRSSFLISAIIPFVYFIVKAIQPMKKYYSYIIIYMFIYSLLIVKAFWILPAWYK